MDGQGDRVGEHVGHDRRTGQVRCDGGSTHRRHAGEPLSEEVEESHYTMPDSVCAGGTVERTRRTARPKTAGTACSSWPEGVPRDFSLEASKAPVLFHQKWCFWDACWSWLGARPRTALWQTGGNGTHAVRSAVGRAVGRTAGQDCGTGGRPTGYSLCKGSIPLGGSPRLLSVARALLPKRVFTSREEGASPVSGRGRESV